MIDCTNKNFSSDRFCSIFSINKIHGIRCGLRTFIPGIRNLDTKLKFLIFLYGIIHIWSYLIIFQRRFIFEYKQNINKAAENPKWCQFNSVTKIGCLFSVVISSEFRMRQYSNHDHRQNAGPLSIKTRKIPKFLCTIDFSFLNDFLGFAYHTSKW